MSAPRLGGALNVHGSSAGFSGGHSFASNSVGFRGSNFGGGFRGDGFRGGFGFHDGFRGGFGFRDRFGFGGFGCCGFGWGFGWGWGWGGFWGPGWGWGWPGYGLGYYPWGWSGYYDDPGYSIGYNDNGNYSSSDNGPVDNNSGNYNAGPVAPDNSGGTAEPQGSPNDNPVSGNVSSSRPTVLLYLKDGTTYAASDYWLQDGVLHYMVNYGGENTLEMDELDLQRTVNENARRGINFSLHPNPSSVNPQPSSNGYAARGSSTDQSNRYHAPQYDNRNNNGNGATPATAPSPAPAPAPLAPQTQTASQTL
ncbi:MAG TPA: hypothetical protein VIH88_13295 [Candidatus Acidoferrales bacterium]